jgi:ketosteroid isomerase-like protein
VSEENVEAVQAVYERWGKGDFQTRLDLLDPHVVLVHEPEFEAGGPSYGIDAVVAFTRGMLEAWTHFTIEAEEITQSGDSVLVAVHQRGTGRTSGVTTDLHYFMVWTFRARKVVRFESIRERARALAAVGLSE